MNSATLAPLLYNCDMPLRRKPKRLPADNPLLRREYDRQLKAARFWTFLAYAEWLQRHGIDPDTGRMTPTGLAFFERLVADQNTRNREERDRRRRRAA